MTKNAMNFNRAKYGLPLYAKRKDPEIKRCYELIAQLEKKEMELRT